MATAAEAAELMKLVESWRAELRAGGAVEHDNVESMLRALLTPPDLPKLPDIPKG